MTIWTVAIVVWMLLVLTGLHAIVERLDKLIELQKKRQDAARLMLVAMREPTEAMLDAGRDHFFRNHPFGAKGIWLAMIDAAIAESVSPPK